MTPLGVVVAAPAVDGTGMRQRAALGLVQKLVAAVAAGSVAETWTPSQINSNCVLSNGDLTATFAGVAQANSPGFGTRAVTTGNFYWETTLVETSIASDDAPVGIGNTSSSTATWRGNFADTVDYYSGNRCLSGRSIVLYGVFSMIKKLFFMAALLAPGLAYGGNPSANLSVQIVPSGPAVPAAAQAAGFTTLAANYDFSQPFYATQSNWLDCGANNDSLPWHVGNPGISLTEFPCNINQRADPVTGDTVMDFQYLTSYNSYGQTGQFNTIGAQTINNGTGTVTVSFPNFYVEAAYRVGPPYCGSHNAGGPNGVWSWGTVGPLEMDFTELWTSDCGYGDAAGANHANNSPLPGYASYQPNNLPPGWIQTAYHRYGTLLTSDGSTSAKACFFVDDILQSPACGEANFTPGQYASRNYLIASATNLTPPLPQNIDLYIKYIRVWSCASWATGHCDGSTLFDNGSLRYWH